MGKGFNAIQEGLRLRPSELVGDDDLEVPMPQETADIETAAKLFHATGVIYYSGVPIHSQSDTPGGTCTIPSMDEARIAAGRCHKLVQQQLLARGTPLDAPFRFREVCRRRKGRVDIRAPSSRALKDMSVEPSVADWHAAWQPTLNSLIQQSSWLPLVQEILGQDVKLLWHGLVVNEAGSELQSWHRDGECLYPNCPHLPAHALTVFVPLVDMTAELGPTEFYPGSHVS